MGANDKVAATFHPYEAVLGDLPAYDDQAASAVKVGEEGQRIMGKLMGHYNGQDPDDEVVIDENSIADLLCDQFQLYTAEGGNDLQGVNVLDATLGGRVVTVEWANGQRFRVLVEEL